MRMRSRSLYQMYIFWPMAWAVMMAGSLPAVLLSLLQRIFYGKNAKSRYRKRSSMGTTMVVCAFSEGQVFWAHVGDSRLYVWQDGSLSQVTVDHSFVMQLVAEGKISKEEMRLHPRKNEITRAVGIERPLSVDTGCFPVSKGTLILLCSDGLSGMVEDDTLSRVIEESPRKEQTDIDALGHRLMELVYAAGARDNVSVILALFE